MSRIRLIGAALLSVLCCSSLANAAIVFETQLRANFDVLFYSTGPLAGAVGAANIPTDTLIAAEAFGVFEFTIDDIAPGQTTANIIGAVSIGRMQGVVPAPIFSISPNVQFIGGTLTNIQQSGGVITSADVSNLEMIWDMELTLDGNTARIQSVAGLPFSGSVSGLPFGVGDQLAGPLPGPVDGLLDNGDGTFNASPAISVSSRFLTVVPEPSSTAVLLFCLAGLGLRRVNRRLDV